MQARDFLDLIERYENGTATAKEKALLEQLIDSTYQPDAYANLSDDEKEKLRMEVKYGLDKLILQDIAPDNQRIITFPWRWVAVAAMLIIAASAGFFLVTKNNTSTEIAANTPIDFIPGSNKAVLSLGDGTLMELDSTVNTIPQQGVAQIISAGGKLSYQATQATSEIIYNTISTPRGGQYQLTLADGSKVWMNAASSLRFPAVFTGQERVVELTGEAYFEIASLQQSSGEKMPFKVRMPSGAEVEVLGTHFNVMAYEEDADIKTTLLEGAVNVSSADHMTIKLSPNQQVLISKQGRLSVIENYDVSEAVAWKDDKFIFNDTDLETIMHQIARWYDVEVVYEGDVRALEFGGIVSRRKNASAVLKLLEQTGTIDFDIEGRKITVKSAKQ